MSNVTPTMRHAVYNTGTLANATPLVVGMADAPLPATVYLGSADATRKIEISVDNANYFVPSYDTSITGMIAVSILSGVASVRFTGVAADIWGIL